MLFIEIQGKQSRSPLADHRSGRCTGNAHGRQAKPAVDQNGVQDDVDDGTGTLGDHGVNGPSCGLKQTLSQNFHKNAKAENTADAGIGDAAFHGFRHIGLHLKERTGTEDTEQHKDNHRNKHQKHAVSGGPVGGFLVLFSQRFAQQGIDTHTDTHSKADLHILHRERQGQGGHCAFRDLGNINAVHHVVQCLHNHGQDHGQRHIEQQLSYGHGAHFVFL